MWFRWRRQRRFRSARRLIGAAVAAEFDEYLSAFEGEELPDGRRRAVRNGHLPER